VNASREKVLSSRISALVDSVFAIVMTILVLEIKVPRDITSYRDFTIQSFLTGYYQDILLYMVVFITLGYLWHIHHDHSGYIVRTDRQYIWINIITLMLVALIPFSSSVVNKFTDDWLAEVFLAVNMLLVGMCNYLSWAYATKAHRLISENVPESLIGWEKGRLMIFPIVSLAAILASFVYPVLASYVLLLAPVSGFFINPAAGER
jgi:uncharacterized membrane protein